MTTAKYLEMLHFARPGEVLEPVHDDPLRRGFRLGLYLAGEHCPIALINSWDRHDCDLLDFCEEYDLPFFEWGLKGDDEMKFTSGLLIALENLERNALIPAAA